MRKKYEAYKMLNSPLSLLSSYFPDFTHRIISII